MNIPDDVQSTLHTDMRDAAREEVFVWAVNRYRMALAVSVAHRALCLCDDCEWVEPMQEGHGTVYQYQYYKCRCGRCKKAMSQYNKSRR